MVISILSFAIGWYIANHTLHLFRMNIKNLHVVWDLFWNRKDAKYVGVIEHKAEARFILTTKKRVMDVRISLHRINYNDIFVADCKVGNPRRVHHPFINENMRTYRKYSDLKIGWYINSIFYVFIDKIGKTLYDKYLENSTLIITLDEIDELLDTENASYIRKNKIENLMNMN
jgi:hypothetical protein